MSRRFACLLSRIVRVSGFLLGYYVVPAIEEIRERIQLFLDDFNSIDSNYP